MPPRPKAASPGVQQFVSAVREETREPLMFEIDGHEVTAYPPKDGQIIMLSTYSTEIDDDDEAGGRELAGASVNFFLSLFEDDDRRWIASQLIDRKAAFDIEDTGPIVEWMSEQWSGGRPTEPSSGSSPSASNTGLRSRRHVAARASGR